MSQIHKKFLVVLIFFILIIAFILPGCQTKGVTISFSPEEGVDFRAITVSTSSNAIVLPEPKKIGYKFIGWFTDTERTMPFDPAQIPIEDITLYAGWQTDEITVTFRAKLSHETVYDIQYRTLPYGSSLSALIPTVPTREGYTGQWNLEDITINNIRIPYIIDAIYTQEPFTITLLPDNDTAPMVIEQYMNQPYDKPDDPTKDGYVFGGWFSDKKFTSPYLFPPLMPNYDITLYAWWLEESEFASTLVYEITNYGEGTNNAIRITELSRIGKFLTNILIPSEIEGLPVKYIGYDIPYADAQSQSVDYTVFETAYLTTISIADSVEVIGTMAFSKSTNLNKINFSADSQLTKIGDAAFYNCSNIRDFALPNKVEYIGDYAFASDETMKVASIDIPYDSQLTYIGDYAFQNAEHLSTFTIPSNMNDINHKAFEGSGISAFELGEGQISFSVNRGAIFTFDNEKLILFPSKGGTLLGVDDYGNPLIEYTIPAITLIIGKHAFAGNSYLTHVVIPNRIQRIEEYAFYNTQNLQQVTFGDLTSSNLLYLEKYAFSGATKIISLDLPSKLKEIHEYAFSAITQDAPMQLKNLTLSSSLERIDQYAFNNCKHLGALSMPSSLQIIADYAFYNCERLTLSFSDTLDNSLSVIGSYTFYNCYNIQTLALPYMVQTIGDYAFSASNTTQQMKLRTIRSIPHGFMFEIAYIGEGAFAHCVALEQLELSKDIASIGEKAFYNCQRLNIIILKEDSSLTKIEPYTFYGCKLLTSIVIPITVTEIGDYAFYGCERLSTITSGTSASQSQVEIIGNSAFERCLALKSSQVDEFSRIPFPKTRIIGERAFLSCQELEEITINDLIEVIGEDAFARCTKLEDVHIETDSNLTTLNKNVFRECNSLKHFHLPNNITELHGNPFAGCNQFTHFTVEPDNQYFKTIDEGFYSVLYSKSGQTLILFPSSVNTSFVIPQEVREIAPYAFYKSRITKLSFYGFGSGTISIGDYAFADSKDLEEVIIPKEVTSIGDYAFYNCNALTNCSIQESYDENLLSIGDYAFFRTAIESIMIPERTTSIGRYAFAENYELDNLTFNELGLFLEDLTIGEYAFNECTSLKNISLSKRLVHLGDYAFSWCISLENIIFPTGNKPLSIGSYVFDNCQLISSITLPGHVTSMGSHVFNYCLRLEEAIISEDINSVTSPYGLELGQYAFYGCNQLESIIIPAQITKIGDYAFFKCTGLNTINYDPSAYDLIIGDYAFSQCPSINTITIPSRVSHIGDFAFYRSGLGSPMSLKTYNNDTVSAYKEDLLFAERNTDLTIGESSFADTALSNVVFPQRVTLIGKNAFSNNINLVFVRFEDNSACTTIDDGAFQNIGALIQNSSTPYDSLNMNEPFLALSELYTIELGAGLTTLGAYAFKNSYLTNVTLNEGLDIIGKGAFWGCTSLIEVDIPSSVTVIDDDAFWGCSALQRVEILSNGEYAIGNYVFSECFSLTELSLKMVSLIGYAPAHNCPNLVALKVADNNPYYKTLNNVLYTKDVTHYSRHYEEDELLILYPAGKEGSSYAISKNTKEIGPNAFSGNPKLTSLIINAQDNNIVEVDDNSFNGTSPKLEFFVTSSVTQAYIQNPMWKNLATRIRSMDTADNNYTIEVLPGDPSSCRITKYIGLPEDTSVFTIRSSIKGLKVKEIGKYAFSNNSIITEITIPQGISKISDYAFENCTSLSTIIISDSVQIIGENAFSGCTSLTSVQFSENSLLDNISDRAFQNCTSLSDISLPWRLSSIGMFAFAGDSNNYMQLQHINFPENSILKDIKAYAFQYNNKLSKITIPRSVENIGTRLFLHCSALTNVEILRGANESLVNMGNENVFLGTPEELMIYVPRQALEDYGIAKHWENIKSQISSLESLEGDFSIAMIEHRYMAAKVITYHGNQEPIFNNLEMLNHLPRITDMDTAEKTFSQIINGTLVTMSYKNIHKQTIQPEIDIYDTEGIAHKVTIEVFEFDIEGIRLLKYTGNESIVQLPTELRNIPVLEIGEYCFSHKITNITIPEGILSINRNAFRHCSNLNKVIIPLSLTTIGKEAFSNLPIEEVNFDNPDEVASSRLMTIDDKAFFNCTYLSEFIIPAACLSIGDYAFSSDLSKGRMRLQKVTLYGVEMASIGSYAFANTNISSITLPKYLSNIKEGAFKNCTYLVTVYIYDDSSTSTIVKIEDNVFEQCYHAKIYVSENKRQRYINDNVWRSYDSSIYPYENIFGDFTINITGIGATQAELVHYIGNASTVTIPSQINDYTITSILQHTFNSTTKTVIIPNTIKSIGIEAFGRSGVEAVYFEDVPTIESIGDNAFRYTPLALIKIPLSVKQIGIGAFSYTKLVDITFDKQDSLTINNEDVPIIELKKDSFSNIDTLTEISLPRRLKTIDVYAFTNSNNLETVDLPQDGWLQQINSYAFEGCSSLKEITIPLSVTTMGTGVFSSCISLEAIYLKRGNDGTASETYEPTTVGAVVLNHINNPFLKIYVPTNSLGAYRELQNWSDYRDHIIPHSIVGDFAYELIGGGSIRLTHYRGSNANLIIPGQIMIGQENYNVGRIGKYFGNATLKTVTMLEGVKQSIEAFAFGECVSLEEIKLPNSVENFFDIDLDPYSYAFENCISLKKINIPHGVTVIPEGLFSGCASLTELIIPQTVNRIHENAFYGCTSLLRIHLTPQTQIDGGNSMFLNTSSHLRIFVPSHLVNNYRTAEFWSLYATRITDTTALYGCFAIEYIHDNEDDEIKIIQFISNIDTLYIPELIYGIKVTQIAQYAIINEVQEVYLPFNSDIVFYDDISDKIKYY